MKKTIFEEMGGTYIRMGITEKFKAENQMEWAARIIKIQVCAR